MLFVYCSIVSFQHTDLQIALVLATAVNDVATVVVGRDVGRHTRMHVARDVLRRDHEAEGFAGIERQAGGCQGHFDFHDFALRELFLAVESQYGDDVGRLCLIEVTVRDAQTAIGSRVLGHPAVVLQHVVSAGREAGNGELAQDIELLVEFLHDEEKIHVIGAIGLHEEVSLGVADEVGLFIDGQIERGLGGIALAEVEGGRVRGRSLVL